MYGWPALRRDLIKEGGLSEKQLGAAFTAGAWSVQGGRFAVGLARDRFGTRYTVCACLAMVMIGSALIANARSDNMAALVGGMLFLGMGSGAQLCCQPVTALFHEAASTAMASLSGAFQMSGLVFLILSAFSEVSGVGRQGAYLTHAAVVLVLFVLSASYLPLGGKYTDDDISVGGKGMFRDEERPKEEPAKEAMESHDMEQHAQEKVSVGGVMLAEVIHAEPPLKDRPLKDLLTSAEYLGLLGWFSIIVTPSQYYVLSIGYQLEQKGDGDGTYTRLFTLLYGGSAILAPLGGMIADVFGVGFGQCAATVLTSASFLILLSPSLDFLQVLGMAFYSVGRLFIFALYFSNIGRRLGFAHYGTLAGTGMLTSAIISMLQYPLFTAAIDGGIDEVNWWCAAVIVACVPYTMWLSLKERREKRAANTSSLLR